MFDKIGKGSLGKTYKSNVPVPVVTEAVQAYGEFLGMTPNVVKELGTDVALADLSRTLMSLYDSVITVQQIEYLYNKLVECESSDAVRTAMFKCFLETGVTLRLPVQLTHALVRKVKGTSGKKVCLSVLKGVSTYGYTPLSGTVTEPVDFKVNIEAWKQLYDKIVAGFEDECFLAHKTDSLKEIEYVLTKPFSICDQVMFILDKQNDISLPCLQLFCCGIAMGSMSHLFAACFLLEDECWPEARTLSHISALQFVKQCYESGSNNIIICQNRPVLHKLLETENIKYVRTCIVIGPSTVLGVNDLSGIFMTDKGSKSSGDSVYPADFTEYVRKHNTTAQDLLTLLRKKYAPDAYKNESDEVIISDIWPVYKKLVGDAVGDVVNDED